MLTWLLVIEYKTDESLVTNDEFPWTPFTMTDSLEDSTPMDACPFWRNPVK